MVLFLCKTNKELLRDKKVIKQWIYRCRKYNCREHDFTWMRAFLSNKNSVCSTIYLPYACRYKNSRATWWIIRYANNGRIKNIKWWNISKIIRNEFLHSFYNGWLMKQGHQHNCYLVIVYWSINFFKNDVHPFLTLDTLLLCMLARNIYLILKYTFKW